MTSAMPVQCSSTNWAVKPTGSSIFFSLNWSLDFFQGFFSQLKQLRKETLKKIPASNPWPLRCRCSVLPTELSSQLGAEIFQPELEPEFQAFFSLLLKLRTNCEDLSSIWSFIRSSNVYSLRIRRLSDRIWSVVHISWDRFPFLYWIIFFFFFNNSYLRYTTQHLQY